MSDKRFWEIVDYYESTNDKTNTILKIVYANNKDYDESIADSKLVFKNLTNIDKQFILDMCI